MKTTIVRFSLVGLAVVLSACSGGGSGGSTPAPSEVAPPVISFSHVFPQGDATAAQGTAWDIVGVKTTLSGQFGDGAGQLYDTLRVDVTFAQNVANALPAPGHLMRSGSQLGVNVSIDTDANAATGVFQTCDVASGIHPFNFFIDPGYGFARLMDGNYSIFGQSAEPIYSGTSNPPEEAVTNASGNVISQTIFLPAINVASGSSVPRIGLDVASFNGLDELTDCVPAGNGELLTDHG